MASTFLYGLILLILLLSIHGHWGKLFIPNQSDGPGNESDALGDDSDGSKRVSDAIGRLLDEVAPYAAVLQFFESLQIVMQGERLTSSWGVRRETFLRPVKPWRSNTAQNGLFGRRVTTPRCNIVRPMAIPLKPYIQPGHC